MEAIKLDKSNTDSVYAEHLKSKLKIYMEALSESGLSRAIIGSGKQDFRFRDDLGVPHFTNAYFNEFVPLRQRPNSFLVLEAGNTPALFVQHHDDYWHSEPPALEPEFVGQFELNEYIKEPDLGVQNGTAYIGKSLSELPDTVAETVLLNPDRLLSYIDYHRAWKTEYEQACLREANQKAVPAHRAAEAAFRRGCSEYQIHMAYLLAANSRESDLPYDSIVALNANAAVLHHMHLSTERPSQSRSFLIDAGASVRGYGSDISRTYVYEPAGSGEGNADFLALIRGVDELQQKIVLEATAGKPYLELHQLAHRLIAQLLVAMGIVRCAVDEALDTGLTNVFFPHGIGHLLGVQVHDKGGHMGNSDGMLKTPPEQYPALRLTRTLEENMVVTIEPGIYFIPSLLSRWQKKTFLNQALINRLAPFGGVRIEDNIICGKATAENLTRNAFSVSCS